MTAPGASVISSASVARHLAEKILTTRSALEGERRQVTVLFTDVAGFTTLAEKLDPEDVHRIIDRCFELITAEVHRFEGTINQYTGDGVMALFGAPTRARACWRSCGRARRSRGVLPRTG
jgi:class 3 adenylate cyclase